VTGRIAIGDKGSRYTARFRRRLPEARRNQVVDSGTAVVLAIVSLSSRCDGVVIAPACVAISSRDTLR
jgi:hypothetical protein